MLGLKLNHVIKRGPRWIGVIAAQFSQLPITWQYITIINYTINYRQQAICWTNDGNDAYTSLGFVYLIASKHKRWLDTCNIICIINIDFALIYSKIFLFDSHDAIFPLCCHSSTIHCWCIWLMWDKIFVCRHSVFHWWFWNILNKPIENDLQPYANNCFVFGDKRGICNNIPLCYCAVCCIFNSPPPGQYGCHVADDIQMHFYEWKVLYFD